MGKIRRYSCSAKNCKSVYSQAEGGIPMLTFPKDLNRCRVWVQNSGNTDLLKPPKNKLYKLRFLCKMHFANDQFLNKYQTRLIKMAIPTIFSEPPLSDEQMEHFEVTPDDEVKFPGNHVFRSLTRQIDIPTPSPHVVIEVSDLPGRISCIEQTSMVPTVSPTSHISPLSDVRIKSEVEIIESEAASPPMVMDHTYATSGSSSDDVDFDPMQLNYTKETASLMTSSTPEPTMLSNSMLQKLVNGDPRNDDVNIELYNELLKMEKKVQDLQQEVDRLKAESQNKNAEAQKRPLLEKDLDLVHVVDVNSRKGRRKVGDKDSKLNEELIALAIFRC